jgi:hypothetical protein
MVDDGEQPCLVTMVKSVTTGKDGKAELTDNAKSDSTFSAKIPVKEVAAGVGAAGAAIAPDIDPTIDVHNIHQVGSGQSLKLEGEQIYAIEYHAVITKPAPPASNTDRNKATNNENKSKWIPAGLGDNILDIRKGCLAVLCWFCYRRRRKALLSVASGPEQEEPDDGHVDSSSLVLSPDPNVVFEAVQRSNDGEQWSKVETDGAGHTYIRASSWNDSNSKSGVDSKTGVGQSN